jgi:hypothetical protein
MVVDRRRFRLWREIGGDDGWVEKGREIGETEVEVERWSSDDQDNREVAEELNWSKAVKKMVRPCEMR